VALAVGGHGDLVAVEEEGAGLAGGELDGPAGPGGGVPGELQEAAAGLGGGAGDGAGGEEVAGLEVAAVAGVVRDHLVHRPVHVAEAAPGEADGGDALVAHLLRGEVDLDGDV